MANIVVVAAADCVVFIAIVDFVAAVADARLFSLVLFLNTSRHFKKVGINGVCYNAFKEDVVLYIIISYSN